jgi:spermidine synthase
VVHSEDSYCGTIRVVDYRFGKRHHREMIIDGLVPGGIDLATRRSVYQYPYLLQSLPVALRPEGRSCLVIGAGAGIVPAWYEARGVATDVVDIDAQVFAVARRFFGYAPTGGVFVENARTFLARPGRRYDYARA